MASHRRVLDGAQNSISLLSGAVGWSGCCCGWRINEATTTNMTRTWRLMMRRSHDAPRHIVQTNSHPEPLNCAVRCATKMCYIIYVVCWHLLYTLICALWNELLDAYKTCARLNGIWTESARRRHLVECPHHACCVCALFPTPPPRGNAVIDLCATASKQFCVIWFIPQRRARSESRTVVATKTASREFRSTRAVVQTPNAQPRFTWTRWFIWRRLFKQYIYIPQNNTKKTHISFLCWVTNDYTNPEKLAHTNITSVRNKK